MLGSGSFGSDSLGSTLITPGDVSDPESLSPIVTTWNGVDARGVVAMDSLQIQDTLGQPVTASFTINHPDNEPVVGDQITIRYFSQVLFVGTIDHVQKLSPDLSLFQYQVDCLDLSQILIRRKLKRNFINLPIVNILDSILDNELLGEPLTIGTIESRATLPLVDAKGGKVLDVLRDMAAATGQTCYLDFDGSIQMRSTLVPIAPLVLNEANVLLDGMTVKTDRETYRNVQTVTVTGTAPSGQDALVSTQQRRNQDQIDARALIEGGTGIYEEYEDITHPTSNDPIQIILLGIGYARLRLAVSGVPRMTVQCRVRGYGFRAGQVATVDLPTFGLSGTMVVQRVTIREQAGRYLFHDLELTTSSLQQRAYEAWLNIVKGGKVTVQMPASITTNLQSYNTPGSFSWVSPITGSVEISCYGSGAGGGGGARITNIPQTPGHVYNGQAAPSTVGANGGVGGKSGKAVTTIDVIAGDQITVVVGSAGVAGSNNTMVYNSSLDTGQTVGVYGVVGGAGNFSYASYRGNIVCQGNGGGGGKRGACTEYYDGWTIYISSFNGGVATNGGGVGDAVSVGGGKAGGNKGTGNPYVQPSAGADGLVEIRW